tara:strand:+ start:631 stop:819 length:189 start_codon:yes stop_codon:yes gene_type:complete
MVILRKEINNMKEISKQKVSEVLTHLFESFYDDENNTKHLDTDFARQIIVVEKYLEYKLKRI